MVFEHGHFPRECSLHNEHKLFELSQRLRVQDIFDVFGERLFNSDLDEWKKDRKLAHAFFNDERFHKFSPKVTRNTLEKGLIPVLEHVSKQPNS